jgi:hypothetical protein
LGKDLIRHPDGTIEERYESDAPEIIRASVPALLSSVGAALLFGAFAIGALPGFGSPRTKTVPVVITAPAKPTLDVVPLDTAANLTTSSFAGSAGDTHDSTVWQIDTVTGNFSTPKWSGLGDSLTSYTRAGASLPLGSGGVYMVRTRHVGSTGGASPWSDTDTFTATVAAFNNCALGANYPGGMTRIFCLDVTQPNQSALNPNIVSQNTQRAWSTNFTSPDSGAFFGQTANDTTYVRFAWRLNSKEYIAANEVKVNAAPDYYCETYIRVTWRSISWQYSGGTAKHLFFQNSGAGFGPNTAPGIQSSGFISTMNSIDRRGKIGPVGDNIWTDDEWWLEDMGTPTNTNMWRNGTLDTIAAISPSRGYNLVTVKPWHGGSGLKNSADDRWDISRMVVYANPC